jgi:hypothetical protein
MDLREILADIHALETDLLDLRKFSNLHPLLCQSFAMLLQPRA